MKIYSETEEENKIIEFMNKYSTYIIFFISLLILHIFIQVFVGTWLDDLRYARWLGMYTPFEFFFYRYETWSSRIFIDTFLIIFVRQKMFIWSILDSVIYTVAVYYIIKVINRLRIKNIVVLGALLFLTYPFIHMGTAGWIVTSVTYLWTFCLGVLSFIPLINNADGKQTSPIGYLIAIISLIYATNLEQCCLLILGFNLLYLINSYFKKEKISLWAVFAVIVAIFSLVLFFCSPGVAARYSSELATWYPEFANFGIIEKIYLGTIPTINILLNNKLVIALFSVVLSSCVILKTKTQFIKIISIVNMGIMLSLTIFNPVLSTFPIFKEVFKVFAARELPALINMPVILAIIICIYILVSSCVMLYYVFDNIYPPIIFIAGFLSRLIMGFSPTVFASSSRTAIYFFMIILMLILSLLHKLYETNKITPRTEPLITGLLMLIAIGNYIFTIISLA